MSIAIVTGNLTPYTRRLYDNYAAKFGADLHIFSCAGREPHRNWELAPPDHCQHETLPGLRWHRNYVSHVYLNPAILKRLSRLSPELVMICGFSPSMAMAAGWARWNRRPYGIAIDGTLQTDPGRSSRVHGLFRHRMIPKAAVGMGASQASLQLLYDWGLPQAAGFEVPLAPAWDAPDDIPDFHERPYDVLYIGGLEDAHKGALFFADVVCAAADQGRHYTVRVAGHGPERQRLENRFREAGIDVHFDGAVDTQAVPDVMRSAKLVAFPSRGDAWGLVATEAVMCGTPVIGTPLATSSPLLLERFGVGLVRPHDVDQWCAAIDDALSSEHRWLSFRERRSEAMDWFSIKRCVLQLHRAFEHGRLQGQGAFACDEATGSV